MPSVRSSDWLLLKRIITSVFVHLQKKINNRSLNESQFVLTVNKVNLYERSTTRDY